jgi:hypothetical protein
LVPLVYFFFYCYSSGASDGWPFSSIFNAAAVFLYKLL